MPASSPPANFGPTNNAQSIFAQRSRYSQALVRAMLNAGGTTPASLGLAALPVFLRANDARDISGNLPQDGGDVYTAADQRAGGRIFTAPGAVRPKFRANAFQGQAGWDMPQLASVTTPNGTDIQPGMGPFRVLMAFSAPGFGNVTLMSQGSDYGGANGFRMNLTATTGTLDLNVIYGSGGTAQTAAQYVSTGNNANKINLAELYFDGVSTITGFLNGVATGFVNGLRSGTPSVNTYTPPALAPNEMAIGSPNAGLAGRTWQFFGIAAMKG